MSGCLPPHSRAAWRASRRAISISAAEGALSDFLLFERTRAISAKDGGASYCPRYGQIESILGGAEQPLLRPVDGCALTTATG